MDLMFSLLSIFSLLLSYAKGLQEAPDGSVCFNQCSGHGDCIDYSCHCFIGFTGDDCSTTFATSENIVPILSAGHFNLTRKNITQVISKHKFILVGFSSYSCHKCIASEPEYQKIANELLIRKIPFARANADEMKSIAIEFGAVSLPSLVFFHKNKPTLYKGFLDKDAVMLYIDKQTGSSYKKLPTIEAVESFMSARKNPEYTMSSVMTIGFFSQHQDIEEDDYQDFIDISKDLQANEDIFFGVVTNKTVCKHYQHTLKLIDRTPSLMVVGEDNTPHSVNLDELYGERFGIKEWLLKKAIPLVGKITNANFALYEKLNIPMLLMFLDLREEMQSSEPGKVVGGRSGGILNEILIDEMRASAKEHVDRIVFGYLDGTLYEDQMRSLGLYGGRERLPSLAFNTRDRSQVPFPEELPINKDTILQFCADFISGKLRSPDDTKEMARKALQRAIPLDKRNKAVRQDVKKAPGVVQGVSEQFGDGITGDKAVVIVTNENFDEIVMNDEKDVLLLLHSKGCESCAHFNVYFKRMAQRFKDLEIPSLVIAQMDVTNAAPPAQYNLMIGPLPLLLMIPASAKYPPWDFYSGVGKVQTMMKWVHKHAGIPFELPNLPHLTEEQKVAYKEQVREREENLEKKRREEKRAMEAEERAQKELQRRKRKEAKAAAAQRASESDSDTTSALTDETLSNEADKSADKRAIPAATGITFDGIDDDDLLEDHDEF